MTIPVVILAGGLGTRLREETDIKPKPMVDIGGHPILWHIMKSYASFGFDEFVICLGYRGDVIKDFFLNYRARQGGVSVDLTTGDFKMHDTQAAESWKVHLLETGLNTLTGGRIRRAADFLGSRRFMATYGDGVCDVDLRELLRFHDEGGRRATLTAVRPPARFGGLTINDDVITEFEEKPQIGEGWINGGFMVLEPEVAGYIDGDDTILERGPLERLARERELGAFRHAGFWQCVDTVRDLTFLREEWASGAPPWKRW